jgi:SAM-dependent methyltransferase
VLAARNPDVTVDIMTSSISDLKPLSQGFSLPNINVFHCAALSATIPHASCSFDMVITNLVASTLGSGECLSFLQDCRRVLKPGGSLHLSLLDPFPQNAGPLLIARTSDLILNVEMANRSTRLSMLLPMTLSRVVGLTNIDISKFLIPVVPRSKATSCNTDTQREETVTDEERLEQLECEVGRTLMQTLYGRFSQPEDDKRWWWGDLEVLNECQNTGATFEVKVIRCQKI